MIKTFHQAKRVIKIVIGFTILIAGLAMIVLPGPATLFIPVGLAILATEFKWAKKLLKKVKDRLTNFK
ncbi:MAG: PGPGW domain-containing protein [Thermodesulfovibrionales bacterium]